MISGMYLGELVRLVLVKFTKSGLLFGGRGSDLLFEPWNFYTKYISEIESDNQGDFTCCMEVLEELGRSWSTTINLIMQIITSLKFIDVLGKIYHKYFLKSAKHIVTNCDCSGLVS